MVTPAALAAAMTSSSRTEPPGWTTARTPASITRYEQTLARTRSDQATLKQQFDDDIARFRELKGE